MNNTLNNTPYNLEERTLEFSKQVIRVCRALQQEPINKRIVDQLVRSAGSIGANYREANEIETKKDFAFRIRIARKEAKETTYWLELLYNANPKHDDISLLIKESIELMKILAAIANRAK